MPWTIRWCDDIGMFAHDRPIPASCVQATDFCRSHCYNDALYPMYPAMRAKDARNEAVWQTIDAEAVRCDLAGRSRQTARAGDRMFACPTTLRRGCWPTNDRCRPGRMQVVHRGGIGQRWRPNWSPVAYLALAR
jgi:hypothetical protein